MLVPFNLNEEKIKALNIPRHVADWQRIRILKEIDDLRYTCMSVGQTDLSMDSLISLKKLKLFYLFKPQIDTTSLTVTSYDNIVEAFDIPLEWYFKTTIDLFTYFKNNGIAATSSEILNNEALKVISNFQGTKFFFIIFNKEYSFRLKRFDVSTFAYSSYSGNFSFDDEETNTSWNFGNGKSFFQLHNSKFSYPWIDFTVNGLTSVYYYQNKNVDWIDKDPNVYESPSAQIGLDWTNRNLYFFDISLEAVPEFLKLKTVTGFIASKLCHFATEQDTFHILRFTPRKPLVDRNITVNVYMPNDGYNPKLISSKTIELFDANNIMYPINLKSTDEYYLQVRKTINIPLENGKNYHLPWYAYKEGNSYSPWPLVQFTSTYLYFLNWPTPQADTTPPPEDSYMVTNGLMKVETVSVELIMRMRPMGTYIKKLFEKNISLYNFPPYVLRCLLAGSYRVRNGLLYSSAKNLYQLEFIEYPITIKEKLETLIFQMESVKALKEDIETKYYYMINNKWYYTENGIQYEFVHPVSLKPITVLSYYAEILFEMCVTWFNAQKEIDTFLEKKKTENEQAYNDAYMNFLRGNATITGPEALAQFEEKLKTGIFYNENGFEYWRKYTPLELSLIEKMKADAVKNLEIYNLNQDIIKQNKENQDKVNQAVIDSNNQIMELAKALARSEMKQIADEIIRKTPVPTVEYIVSRAEKEEKIPTIVLQEWVNENPYYFAIPELKNAVDSILKSLTDAEQRVTTAIVANIVSEINYTKALNELFIVKR